MEKKLWGARTVFPPPCPRHIFEPLVPQKPTKLLGAPKVFFHDPVPQKPTKLLGAPKVFFHDPVPVTYSNPWSHKSRQNFPGPQKFFSTILSQSHIRTPGPTKADKTFRGPKSFFPRSCPSHIFEPLIPQTPTKLSGAPKVLLCTHTHWDKHPPPNPTSRPW